VKSKNYQRQLVSAAKGLDKELAGGQENVVEIIRSYN